MVFFAAAARYLWAAPLVDEAWLLPFYNPATFSSSDVLTGASIAALTYIGFDGISTLSEEVENPRRNIMRATVLTCAITGVLATAQVYIAQVIWPDYNTFPDADTAYVYVAGRVGGPWLFALVNVSLLVASIGSGMGAQLGAARLCLPWAGEYAAAEILRSAVGRSRARECSAAVGAFSVIGGFALSYQLAAELLNFGAFIAFMGVNVAALRYALRTGNRDLSSVLPPVAGFLICFYIWLNLRPVAQVLGGSWLALGLLYAMWRRRSRSYAEA